MHDIWTPGRKELVSKDDEKTNAASPVETLCGAKDLQQQQQQGSVSRQEREDACGCVMLTNVIWQEFNIHKEKEKDHEDPQPDLLSQASGRASMQARSACCSLAALLAVDDRTRHLYNMMRACRRTACASGWGSSRWT